MRGIRGGPRRVLASSVASVASLALIVGMSMITTPAWADDDSSDQNVSSNSSSDDTAEAKAKADADAKAWAKAEAKAQAEAEAKAAKEAKAKAEAEAKAKVDADAKARAKAEAKAQAKAEAKAAKEAKKPSESGDKDSSQGSELTLANVKTVAPTFTEAASADARAVVTIPSVDCIVYAINGSTVSAGDHNEAADASVKVTAKVASEKCELSGETEWTHKFTAPVTETSSASPEPTVQKSTPPAPAINGSTGTPTLKGPIVGDPPQTPSVSCEVSPAEGPLGTTFTVSVTGTNIQNGSFLQVNVNPGNYSGSSKNNAKTYEFEVTPTTAGPYTVDCVAIHDNNRSASAPGSFVVYTNISPDGPVPGKAPTCADQNYHYSLPDLIDGVSGYTLDGVPITGSTFTVPADGTKHSVAAVADSNYKITSGPWTVGGPAATGCALTLKANLTPESSPTCAVQSTKYTIPALVEGIEKYTSNGSTVAPGVLMVPAGQTLTVNVVLTAGYTANVTSWTLEGGEPAEGCILTLPKELSPKLSPTCTVQSSTYVLPSGEGIIGFKDSDDVMYVPGATVVVPAGETLKLTLVLEDGYTSDNTTWTLGEAPMDCSVIPNAPILTTSPQCGAQKVVYTIPDFVDHVTGYIDKVGKKTYAAGETITLEAGQELVLDVIVDEGYTANPAQWKLGEAAVDCTVYPTKPSQTEAPSCDTEEAPIATYTIPDFVDHVTSYVDEDGNTYAAGDTFQLAPGASLRIRAVVEDGYTASPEHWDISEPDLDCPGPTSPQQMTCAATPQYSSGTVPIALSMSQLTETTPAPGGGYKYTITVSLRGTSQTWTFTPGHSVANGYVFNYTMQPTLLAGYYDVNCSFIHDQSGQHSSGSKDTFFVVDNTPPVVAIVDTPAQCVVDDQVITASFDDTNLASSSLVLTGPDGVVDSVAGTTGTSLSLNVNVSTLANGTYTITASGKDMTGNTTTTTETFVVNNKVCGLPGATEVAPSVSCSLDHTAVVTLDVANKWAAFDGTWNVLGIKDVKTVNTAPPSTKFVVDTGKTVLAAGSGTFTASRETPVELSKSFSVSYTGIDCSVPPEPTVVVPNPPTFVDATCTSDAGVGLVGTEGLNYTVTGADITDGKFALPATITVTATPVSSDYVIKGGATSSWTHEFKVPTGCEPLPIVGGGSTTTPSTVGTVTDNGDEQLPYTGGEPLVVFAWGAAASVVGLLLWLIANKRRREDDNAQPAS